MSKWQSLILVGIFLIVACVSPAFGSSTKTECNDVPIVKLEGISGSSAPVPLFDEETIKLDLPTGVHDEEFVVLARIERSGMNLAIRFALQETYSV